jgi:hypothetical protein
MCSATATATAIAIATSRGQRVQLLFKCALYCARNRRQGAVYNATTTQLKDELDRQNCRASRMI